MESIGVASGCGCKKVYRFPHITYPYFSCICSFFAAASLLFVHKKKCFSFLYMYKSTIPDIKHGGEKKSCSKLYACYIECSATILHSNSANITLYCTHTHHKENTI